MMDDLASPLERALIAYSKVERALLRAPLRTLTPALGGALILLGAVTSVALINSAGQSPFAPSGSTLHGGLAALFLVLGLGLLVRHAAAVLALYLVVGGLQAVPYLLAGRQLFASAHSHRVALLVLAAELLILTAMAFAIRRYGADGGSHP